MNGEEVFTYSQFQRQRHFILHPFRLNKRFLGLAFLILLSAHIVQSQENSIPSSTAQVRPVQNDNAVATIPVLDQGMNFITTNLTSNKNFVTVPVLRPEPYINGSEEGVMQKNNDREPPIDFAGQAKPAEAKPMEGNDSQSSNQTDPLISELQEIKTTPAAPSTPIPGFEVQASPGIGIPADAKMAEQEKPEQPPEAAPTAIDPLKLPSNENESSTSKELLKKNGKDAVSRGEDQSQNPQQPSTPKKIAGIADLVEYVAGFLRGLFA